LFEIEIKKDIECGDLSFEVWQTIQNNRNSKVIDKKNLNANQIKELKKIHSFLSDYISKWFDSEHRLGSWYKSATGYTLTQFCNKTRDCHCRSNWKLRVNVPSGKAELYFNKQCDHLKNHNELNSQEETSVNSEEIQMNTDCEQNKSNDSAYSGLRSN